MTKSTHELLREIKKVAQRKPESHYTAADISHFQFQMQRCGKYAQLMDVWVCIAES